MADTGWFGLVAGGVEPDQGVVVHDGAALVFGDFDKRHPQHAGVDADTPQVGCHGAAQRDGEAPPQFRGVPVEQHMPGVVIALRAQRLPDFRVVAAVSRVAPQRFPMRAVRLATAGRVAHRVSQPGPVTAGVHRAEARGGQGGEDLRAVSGGVGHAVMPALGAGVHELPGVGGIEVRAGGADCGAAVAAADQHRHSPALVGVVGAGLNRVGAKPHRGAALPPRLVAR